MQAKQQIPDLCLGTDLMVGFPNENDDFAQTCELHGDAFFLLSRVHLFRKTRNRGSRMVPIPMEERRAESPRRLSPQRECLSMRSKKDENFVCYSKIPRMTSIAVTRINA